jgi:hypothetical protein
MQKDVCKCGRKCRSKGQRDCQACHRIAVAKYRVAHSLTPEARAKARCRAYAAVYLKRGKILRLACEVCGSLSSVMHHDDYTAPLSIRWLCRRHLPPKIVVIVRDRTNLAHIPGDGHAPPPPMVVEEARDPYQEDAHLTRP